MVGGEGGSRDGLVRQTGRAVIWGQGTREHGGRGGQGGGRWEMGSAKVGVMKAGRRGMGEGEEETEGRAVEKGQCKSGQEGADVAFTEVDTDATVPLSPPSVRHHVQPTTLFLLRIGTKTLTHRW